LKWRALEICAQDATAGRKDIGTTVKEIEGRKAVAGRIKSVIIEKSKRWT